MKSWVKVHKNLWPHEAVPELLEPAAKRNLEGERDQAFFVESTIPTSLLFSALTSAIIQARSAFRFRSAASKLLYAILQKLLQTGEMNVHFTQEGQQFGIHIPAGGGFPSAVLFALLGAEGVESVKAAWNTDAEDGC